MAKVRRGPRRRKLSDLIVQDIKRWIVSQRLGPGDRLPKERDLIAHYGCSKGTVREALKALEVEGLIVLRTGPSGGAYLAEAGIDQATRALRNYLHFQHLDGRQAYELRKIVEVEAAASVVGRLHEEDFRELERNIELCERLRNDDAAQRELRVAELGFHNHLAAICPNPLLGFMVRFVSDIVRDLMDLKRTYRPRRRRFGEDNCYYHRRLVEAFRAEDELLVRQLMHEHMCNSEAHTLALEGEVAHRFLLDFDND